MWSGFNVLAQEASLNISITWSDSWLILNGEYAHIQAFFINTKLFSALQDNTYLVTSRPSTAFIISIPIFCVYSISFVIDFGLKFLVRTIFFFILISFALFSCWEFIPVVRINTTILTSRNYSYLFWAYTLSSENSPCTQEVKYSQVEKFPISHRTGMAKNLALANIK